MRVKVFGNLVFIWLIIFINLKIKNYKYDLLWFYTLVIYNSTETEQILRIQQQSTKKPMISFVLA